MPVIDNVEDLMTWLSKKLEPICDADPNALAKYVVALAKKDKTLEELKATCIDQLGVFLVNETQAFVDDLFVALATKSYIPGKSANSTVEGESIGKQEPPPPQPAASAPAGPADLPTGAEITSTKEDGRTRSSNRDVTGENDERDHRRIRRHSRSRSRSKSRSNSPRSRSRSYSPRRRRRDDDRRRREDRPDRYGPSRRYGDRDRDRDRDRNRDRDFRDRDRDRDRDRLRNRDGRESSRYDDRGRNRDRDLERDRDDRLKDNNINPKPSAISSVITVVSNDGPEPAQGPSKPGEQPIRRIRQRCRDYDEKGFCMKGEFCPYDHGNDPVVVEDIDMFRPPPNMDNRPPVPSQPPAPQPPLPPLPPSQPPPPMIPPFGMPPPGFRPGMPLPPPLGGMPMPPMRMHGPPRANGPPPGPPPGLPPHMRGLPPPPTSVPPPPLPPMPQMMNRPPPPLPPVSDASMPPSVPQPPSSPPRESSPPPPPAEPKTTTPFRSSQDFQMEGYNPEDPSMEAQEASRPSYYAGGGRPPRQASSNLRTLVGIQTVPTTTREEMEAIDALTKDSSDESQSERTVVDLSKGQENLGIHEEQRRSVIKNDDGPMGYQPKRPFNHSGPVGGPGGAVDLRARIGGKGKGKFVPNNRILEVRKIPKEFNNITKLNEHFSKFGNIVNLQIAYAQDLEAALVTFSTHLEAKKAYQSTEAVFNNRFVKVFWHIPPENTTGENESNHQVRKPPKQRIQLPTKKQLTVIRNHPVSQEKAVIQPNNPTLTRTIINQNAVAINQRLVTVQNNLANAKKAAAAHNTATVAKKLAAAQEAVRKKQEEAKKLMAKKQLEIQKQKQELMNGFIQQQKMLINKLEQGKATMTTLKRAEIMKSIKMLTENIEKTKKELMDAKPKQKDKKQAERELLDTELDLYNQQSEGGDTSELRKRVDDLRREAQALGLLDNAGGSRGRGHPRSIRGRGGRGRGRGFMAARRRSSNTKLVMDKRPRGLVVGGFAAEDKDEVLVHLNSFGEIENVEFNEDSVTYVLEFKTRQEAEMAVAKGNQFKGDSLSLAWHKQQDAASEMMVDSLEAGEEMEEEEEEEMEEDLDDDLLLVDDEEEEDDEEGRSWKR